jgi:hypothetical protein
VIIHEHDVHRASLILKNPTPLSLVTEGNLKHDLCARARLGTNRQAAADMQQAFAHKSQSKMVALVRGELVRIKAAAIVGDGDPGLAILKLKGNLNAVCASVLAGVRQGFLNDPQQLDSDARLKSMFSQPKWDS